VNILAQGALVVSTPDTGPALPDLTPAGGGTAATIASTIVLGLIVLATLARAARNYTRGRDQADRRPQP
jgi:hypothetical protein